MTHFIAPSADRDLARRVALFIEQQQLNAGTQLFVEADRGVVTLKGTVPTFHRRQLLHSLARRVAGVVQVVDELNVDYLPLTKRPSAQPWPPRSLSLAHHAAG